MEFSTRDALPALTPQYLEARLKDAFDRDRAADVVLPTWLDGLNVSPGDGITERELRFFNEITTHVIPAFIRECVRRWPTVFAELCAAYEARIERTAPRNESDLDDEAMSWIITPEPDEQVDDDRLKILSWLRSGKFIRAWSRIVGKSATDLNRSRARYFDALARRLTSAPQAAVRTIKVNDDIAIGIDAISKVIRRAPKNTLKMIEGGKLPAGKIGGHYCASRAMLRSLKPAAVRVQKDGRLAA